MTCTLLSVHTKVIMTILRCYPQARHEEVKEQQIPMTS
jgi:hypothetical protein